MRRTVAVLSVLVLALALAVSRVGLAIHELVGHGVTALAVGGRVTGWSLHWFGGGWLSYARPRDGNTFTDYLVDTGGIAIELALAGLAALAARLRTGPVAQLGFAGAAWALAIHAGWYLAAGTYHGFGDGWLLHRQLGDARLAVVIPAGLAIVIAGHFAGLRIGARLRGLVPAATPRRQLGAVAIALALGLAGHAALAIAELRLRTDPTYHATMQTAGDRAVATELAARVETARTAGAPLDERQVAAVRDQLEAQHRQLPVGALLIVAIGLAAVAGIARSRPPDESASPPGRAVAVAVALAVAAVGAVVLLDTQAPFPLVTTASSGIHWSSPWHLPTNPHAHDARPAAT